MDRLSVLRRRPEGRLVCVPKISDVAHLNGISTASWLEPDDHCSAGFLALISNGLSQEGNKMALESFKKPGSALLQLLFMTVVASRNSSARIRRSSEQPSGSSGVLKIPVHANWRRAQLHQRQPANRGEGGVLRLKWGQENLCHSGVSS